MTHGGLKMYSFKIRDNMPDLIWNIRRAKTFHHFSSFVCVCVCVSLSVVCIIYNKHVLYSPNLWLVYLIITHTELSWIWLGIYTLKLHAVTFWTLKYRNYNYSLWEFGSMITASECRFLEYLIILERLKSSFYAEGNL